MIGTCLDRFVAAMLAFGVAASVASCTKVVESVPLEYAASENGLSCHSALGAYNLPRALLSLSVSSNGATITPPTVKPKMIADRAQTFCLDYLAAANADDIVTVNRDQRGLLTSISSEVKDKTPEIAKALIETASNVAIAAGRQTLDVAGREQLDLDFDPFVWNELMMAKRALRRFGFCLYVEGHSFSVHGLSAAGLRAAAQRWCSTEQPRPFLKDDTLATLPVPESVARTGVLYRPNIAFRVVILRKNDPGKRQEPWQLYQSVMIEMPNISPVLSVGISRALFARRKTTIKFDQGVLTDVAIEKDSELVGFVSIPLAAAKAIVDVPAQIIKIRIADVNNQTALLNAQGALIAQLTAYEQLVNARQAAGTGGNSGGAKSASANTASIYGACRNGGGSQADCAAIAGSGGL
jgi:hypothetical protein